MTAEETKGLERMILQLINLSPDKRDLAQIHLDTLMLVQTREERNKKQKEVS